MAQDYSQVNFRIPTKLKEDIEKASLANNRSITAELVSRLERSFTPQSAELTIDQLEQITRAAGASYMAVIAKHLDTLDEESGNKVLRNIVKEAAEDFENIKKAP